MSRVYTVTQLNTEIKGLLESNPSFRNVFVQGEISNYKQHTSGHHYMTLKDEGGAINAVLFRSDAMRLKFRPANGMKVIARGRVSSFPKTGQVQLYIADLVPDGAGALHMAFEQLKRRLYEEGLFDEAHKQPLPLMPERIALVTSPTGAAVHDMLRILKRRFPLAEVQIWPVLVQGESAPAEIARTLRIVSSLHAADLVITGRGGGSLEDLWAFNDERVARAIYECEIPVISAVGHEPDVTIADFVADLRAPTPSGAAELAVPDQNELRLTIDQLESRLHAAMEKRLTVRRTRVDALAARLEQRTPARYLAEKRVRTQELTGRLTAAQMRALQTARTRLQHQAGQLMNAQRSLLAQRRAALGRQAAQLDALSPLKVLHRGFAVAADARGRIVTDSGTLQPGDALTLRLAKGNAQVRVESIESR